jgi:hypothetical protein
MSRSPRAFCFFTHSRRKTASHFSWKCSSSIATLHGVAYHRTDTRGNGHRDSTSESNADCGFYYLGASSPSANGAQQRDNDKRHTEHGGNEYILRGKLSIRRPLRGCRRSSPAFTTTPPLRPCVTLPRPTETHWPAHGNRLFQPIGPLRQLSCPRPPCGIVRRAEHR